MPSESVTNRIVRLWADEQLAWTVPESWQWKARVKAQAKRDAELRWLRASMSADGIPEHIQQLVLAQW